MMLRVNKMSPCTEASSLSQLLSSAMNIPGYMKDAAGKCFIWVNEAFSKWVGKPVSECLGMSDADVFPSEWAVTNGHRDIQMAESLDMSHFSSDDLTEFAGNCLLLRSYKLVLRDKTGLVVGLLSFFHELSVKDFDSIKLDYSFFDHHSADLLSIISRGRFLHLNSAWEQALGWSRIELMSRHCLSFIHRGDRRLTIAAFQSAQPGDLIQVRIRWRRKDGSYSLLSWHASVLPNKSVYLSVSRDVTASEEMRRKLECQNRQLTALYDVARQTARSSDIEVALAAVKSAIQRYLPVDTMGLFLENKPATTLELRYNNGMSQELFANLPLSMDDTTMVGKTFITGLPYLSSIEDYPDTRLRTLLVREGFQLIATFPVTAAVDTLGVIAVASYSRADDTEGLLPLLAAMGNLLGMALSKSQLYNSLNRELTERIEAEQRFRLIAETVDSAFWIGTPDMKMTYLSPAFERIWGISSDSIYSDAGLLLRCIHVEDRSVAQIKERPNLDTPWSIEYRIVRPDGEVRWVEDKGYPVQSSDGRVKSIVGVVTDITDRKKLEHELIRVATVDSLTGAYTRAHFFKLFEDEFSRSRRYCRPLSIIILDIDFFKTINDTHGHHAGDVTLKTLADACVSRLRSIDSFGRLGGEEFAVLMPETRLPEAYIVAERLRQAVEADSTKVYDVDIRCTISLGVASLEDEDTNSSSLLRRADRGLYSAKARGRNQVREGPTNLMLNKTLEYKEDEG